jgi:S1-C subfamily serine protease
VTPASGSERSEGRTGVSRRYVATLAGVAVLLLAVGLVARHWLQPTDAGHAAPPSQATALQQFSMAGQLRRTAAFVSERVTEAAAAVAFVAEVGSAGIRWSRDSVLTTDHEHVVRMIASRAADSAHRVAVVAPDTVRRDWLLVVGRDASNRVFSTTILSGGRAATDCAGRPVETYVLGSPPDDRFAGGGVFNVEGELLGMVAWCGDRVRAVPTRELRRLLAESRAPAVIESPLGFAVAGADSTARRFLGTDSIALVTAVRRGSVADAMGLRVGDRVVAVDGRPVSAAGALALLGRASVDSLTVLRARGRGLARQTLATRGALSAANGFGITVAAARNPAGVSIAYVAPGSSGADAGLRPGDRLLRVGDTPVSSTVAATRLLAATADSATARGTLVVIERDGVERGMVLRPPRPRSTRNETPR